jgi:hypothetical protein
MKGDVRTVKERPDSRPSIVLLGTGAVGKSTIVRQVQLTQGKGLTEKDQNRAINAMLDALVRMTSAVCDTLLESGAEDIPDSIFQNMETVADIAAKNRYHVLIDGTASFSDREMEQQLLATCLKDVWANKNVKQCRTAMDAKLLENHLAFLTADLCLKHVESLFDSGFQLDREDFIRVRNPTTIMCKTVGIHNGEVPSFFFLPSSPP